MSGNSSTWDAFRFTTCADIICGLKVATVCSISTLITLGNLAALITLGVTPSLRNCHGLLIMSLCLADLATGLVASAFIYPSVFNQWPFGDTLCLVGASIEAVVKKASLLTLTLLSVERYMAVVYPLRYTRIVTKQKILTGIVSCWLISILFLITLFLTRQIVYQYAWVLHSCTITYTNQVLSLALSIGLFTLPSLATVTVTSVLAWVSMKQNTRLRASMISKLERGGRTRRAIRFFRMSRIMAFTFYACWAPMTIVGFASVVAGVRHPWGVFFALYWLQISNSLCNVVIYFVMNDTFRRRARQLFLSPLVALCRI